MSILGRRFSTKLMATMAGVMLLVALLPAWSITPKRDITLVVRGMAFYLENDPSTPNPTIEMKVGERVRVVIKNQDRGFTHDFAVPVLHAATKQTDWNESGHVVFKAPKKPGTYEYVCQPHRLMMKGTIQVH